MKSFVCIPTKWAFFCMWLAYCFPTRSFAKNSAENHMKNSFWDFFRYYIEHNSLAWIYATYHLRWSVKFRPLGFNWYSQKFTINRVGWQWCRWHYDGASLKMVVAESLSFFGFGDDFFNEKNRSSTSQIGDTNCIQHSSPKSISFCLIPDKKTRLCKVKK